MSENTLKTEVTVEIQRVNSDVIDDHLRDSTVVLRDILENSGSDGSEIETDTGEVSTLQDSLAINGSLICTSGIDVGFANNNNRLTCKHCGKLYKTANSLRSHHQLAHPVDDTKWRCNKCDKNYPSSLSYQCHVRYMHRYEHRCTACYRTFATPDLLNVHSEYCTKTDSPCPQCDKIFDSQLALRNHMKYKHPQEKDHWCEKCRRSFTSTSKLLNHNAIKHSGATDCNKCGKTFNTTTALQSHFLYKHAENRHWCNQCYKAFAKEASLLKHLARKHFYVEDVAILGEGGRQ